MKITILLIVLFTLSLASESRAYRILAVFPYNGKSHNIFFEALMKGLAKRGHQVDVVTHFPLKKPVKNYNDIISLDGTLESVMNNFTMEFISFMNDDSTNVISNLYGNRLCSFLGLDSMQKLMNNPPRDPPYDIVIVEAFTANCYFGLGYIFKVPVLAVSTAAEFPWISDFIGNDDNLAYVPNTFYHSIGELNYWGRVENFVTYFMELRKYHSATAKIQTEAMRKYLSSDIPDIREVEKNVALTLVNSNPIISGIKPITPSLVQVAGLHIEENDETLSPELKEWMDEGKYGVVYFTLGSMVLMETMPVEQLKGIFSALKKIAPIRVLVKIVDKSKLPSGLPKNVKTLPWTPQIPLLAHPNLKLFITHGGLGGLIEALHFGVPMIGIPLFSDQFRNCKLFVAKQMMVTISLEKLSEQTLDSALQTVLYDPIYKEKSVYYSKLFRDRPMSPMDTANFWIEHVIRNGPVLRSPALKYTWWQLALLDVYALFLFSFILALLLATFIIRMILKTILKMVSRNYHIETNKKKIKSDCVFKREKAFKMLQKTLFFLLFIITSLHQFSAYRILGIFPLNGRSHEMMFESLMKGLARRGHQVDVVTHFPPKNPPKNYKNIINLSGTMESLVNNFTIDFVLGMADDVGTHVATVYGNRLCHLMGLEEMQNLLKNPPSNPPYDVLITEAFGANCFMGIGRHLNIPVIAASSAIEYPWVSEFTGNNDNLAVVPNALYMAFGQMSFWQRLKNTLVYHNEIRKFQKLTEHPQTELMKKYINSSTPNIREIERSVALTLVNSHPIIYGVRPVLPTVVEIGGLHVEESESTLPQDLKKWMDESNSGVIYFTFGSMVLVETLPEATLKTLYRSFAKIAPVRILTKVADESKLPPGLPENVKTLPWIPQQAVLAHNNTKVFMTHGGLMGSQEALYYGVPMIGVPLFADQPRNVEAFVAKNMSIKLPLADFSEEKLDAVFKAILYDPKYTKYAKYYSNLFRDRPISAMDSAVFWVEYVARNGPNVLRPPSLTLTWWQLALIDVYGFIFLVFIVVKFMLFCAIKLVIQKLLSYFETKESTKKKL
ncbi:uncharacterized protein LOC106639852 [Copidosoma floridanum]|uniref:uncharacterized protein LOC106639852 n=1 Tax=Copidosoma floridanum TaxID=29053 RepID=UPI000C6FCACD|nr:uncharacterized protein LOC106639852 [Copidosoma floridanum]